MTEVLAPPETTRPATPGILSELKRALGEARQRNALLWTPRANPLVAMRGLSRDVDQILAQLWQQLPIPQASLLAVGGYGRGHLAPYSDVDLLILMPDDYSEEAIRPAAETLISAFWDIGLDAGHSIRSISECISHAQSDLTIATALLESRWIAGPKSPQRKLTQAWFEHINVKEFAQGKLLEMQQRHGRHHDSPYSLEPNCKESPGGLRDLQILRWITQAFGLGHHWRDLARDGLITEREASEVERAQRLLLLIRGHLHLSAGRREDRLVFDLQTDVAQRLGIISRGGRRASEMLMQRYYRAAKAIFQISSMLLANLEPRLFPSAAMPAGTQARRIDDAFDEVYGLLEIRDEQHFAKDPGAMLRAFLCVQQHPELRGMSAKTMRALWNYRDLIDAEFRKNPDHKQCFLSIFQQPRGIVHGLRLMNNLGILGRMLPVFRKIVGQMQHDLFHVYTVDQHILQVIRNLRRFTMDEHAHEFPLCSQLMAEFQSPWILYCAALFHDIAKGRGGDHSSLGRLEVRRFAREYGIDAETSKLLAFLVEHHLTMSQVAQKQDLTDPETIASFRALVRTPQRLIALYLLTVADIRGTSPKAWTNWKARLLEELYRRTASSMQSRPSRRQQEPLPAQDIVAAKISEAERLLRLRGKDPIAAKAFWKTLTLQYFLRHEPGEIEWHARLLAERPKVSDPVVIARRSPDGVGLQIVVYLPDEDDLFARICAYFDGQNISICDAKIHTTSDGYAMDTFVVELQSSEGLHREMLTIIEAGLARVLAERGPLPPPSQGRQSRQSKYFPIPPHIDLQPDSRGQFHVLSVTAADRTGLLYAIAKTLANHRVRLQTARVMTHGERAEDVFLIQGESIGEEKKQIALEADLLKAVAA